MAELRLDHRVLVVSPFGLEAARGNATTAQRTQHRLESRGASVHLVTPPELHAAIADFAPHVIHGVHAGHFARALAHEGPIASGDQALVLTIGGNDMYEDLDVATDAQHPGGHYEGAWQLVERADAIVTSTHAQYRALVERHPRSGDVFLAHKYPEVGHAPIEGLDELIELQGGVAGEGVVGQHDLASMRTPVVGWCGALRHQKRPEWLLPFHRALRAELPRLVTLVAGPAPSHPAGVALEAELLVEPGVLRIAHFPGGPDGAVGTLLGHCDLVLNTSRTEGVANFLLEALHERVPVLAARTPGNRDWLDDQAWLFDELVEAIAKALELLTNDAEREQLGRRGRDWLEQHADPEREADVLCRAHLRALDLA